MLNSTLNYWIRFFLIDHSSKLVEQEQASTRDLLIVIKKNKQMKNKDNQLSVPNTSSSHIAPPPVEIIEWNFNNEWRINKPKFSSQFWTNEMKFDEKQASLLNNSTSQNKKVNQEPVTPVKTDKTSIPISQKIMKPTNSWITQPCQNSNKILKVESKTQTEHKNKSKNRKNSMLDVLGRFACVKPNNQKNEQIEEWQ